MSTQHQEKWAQKADEARDAMEAGDFEKARRLQEESTRLWVEIQAQEIKDCISEIERHKT